MKTWREELLSVLSRSGETYLSGEELAGRFGCSRAAIWKKISILRSEGYPIEATTNRGYRMTRKDREFEHQVEAALEAARLTGAFSVHVAATTPSTNLLAREAGARGEKEIGVFAAMQQTAGRGRRGKTWVSNTDEGLWFSFLLRPALEPRTASSLTLLFGLCILKALQRICNIPVGIKWPNDIISLQNGKKICGILSETSMEDNQVSYAVVGCGINVSQKNFPEELEPVATSLSMEGVQTGEDARTGEGTKITKASLLTAILQEVAVRYPDFVKDPTHFLSEYRANCATIGRAVRIESGTQTEGVAQGISDAGDLLVKTKDGTLLTCTSGEVSVRGMLGYL